jgi:folate-binding protein YgfZ
MARALVDRPRRQRAARRRPCPPSGGLGRRAQRRGHLTAPVAEAFVPQMPNYESVDGVSFKKGCYPGQEVVARSQFAAPSSGAPCGLGRWRAAQAGQDVFALDERASRWADRPGRARAAGRHGGDRVDPAGGDAGRPARRRRRGRP